MSNSFDDILEQIKSEGEEEREAIENAEKLSEIIYKISEARISKGLTQRQLSEKCGIKQSAIARMESLQAVPRIDTLIRIARYLDISIEVESTARMKVPGTIIDFQTSSNRYSWSTYNTNEKYCAYAVT